MKDYLSLKIQIKCSVLEVESVFIIMVFDVVRNKTYLQFTYNQLFTLRRMSQRYQYFGERMLFGREWFFVGDGSSWCCDFLSDEASTRMKIEQNEAMKERICSQLPLESS